MKRCTPHKVATDHRVGNAWRCSECFTLGKWTTGWMYYGNIECPGCQQQAVDRVLCPTCAGRCVTPGEVPRTRRHQRRYEARDGR